MPRRPRPRFTPRLRNRMGPGQSVPRGPEAPIGLEVRQEDGVRAKELGDKTWLFTWPSFYYRN